VGHEGEDSAALIADARYVLHRAAGIMRIARITPAMLVHVVEDGIEAGEDFRGGHQLALAVGDGQVKVLDAFGEDAGAFRVDLHVRPAALEAPGVVVGEGSNEARIGRLRQDTGLNHYLEAVADAPAPGLRFR